MRALNSAVHAVYDVTKVFIFIYIYIYIYIYMYIYFTKCRYRETFLQLSGDIWLSRDMENVSR